VGSLAPHRQVARSEDGEGPTGRTHVVPFTGARSPPIHTLQGLVQQLGRADGNLVIAEDLARERARGHGERMEEEVGPQPDVPPVAGLMTVACLQSSKEGNAGPTALKHRIVLPAVEQGDGGEFGECGALLLAIHTLLSVRADPAALHGECDVHSRAERPDCACNGVVHEWQEEVRDWPLMHTAVQSWHRGPARTDFRMAVWRE